MAKTATLRLAMRYINNPEDVSYLGTDGGYAVRYPEEFSFMVGRAARAQPLPANVLAVDTTALNATGFLALGIFKRAREARLQAAAARIDARRWSEVSGLVDPSADRFGNTPAYISAGGYFRGGYMFLASVEVILAIEAQPIGSDWAYASARITISEISRLVFADDGVVMITRPSADDGEDEFSLLSLYPSPLTSDLLFVLRGLWNGEPEGETGWSLWAGPDYPRGQWDAHLK